jgi:hypothetical protein
MLYAFIAARQKGIRELTEKLGDARNSRFSWVVMIWRGSSKRCERDCIVMMCGSSFDWRHRAARHWMVQRCSASGAKKDFSEGQQGEGCASRRRHPLRSLPEERTCGPRIEAPLAARATTPMTTRKSSSPLRKPVVNLLAIEFPMMRPYNDNGWERVPTKNPRV